MLARDHFLWLGSLAIVATVAACSLNPQPDPPMNDPSNLHDAAIGGSGGMGMGGSSGAAGGSMGGSGGYKPADAGAGTDAQGADDGSCFDCNCPCASADDGGCEGGAWDADPDAMCPCEAGTDANAVEDADAADEAVTED